MKKNKNENKIILASASPRRKYLLGMLLGNFGLKFIVVPSRIDENIPDGLRNIPSFISNLALSKAAEVSLTKKGVIIGADTIVILNNEILGKPADINDAKRMLRKLSGKTHKVITGIALIDTINKKYTMDHEVTKVTFRKLSESEIKFYVASGSPMDKAGSYGIQDDFGSTFVSKINGDYFNVVGLPVVKTYMMLKQFLKLGM